MEGIYLNLPIYAKEMNINIFKEQNGRKKNKTKKELWNELESHV